MSSVRDKYLKEETMTKEQKAQMKNLNSPEGKKLRKALGKAIHRYIFKQPDYFEELSELIDQDYTYSTGDADTDLAYVVWVQVFKELEAWVKKL